MCRELSIVILIINIWISSVLSANGPIVQIAKGKIQGVILKSWNGNDYYAFHNIPYATPPINENRFQLPKQPEAWEGILNCTENRVACYQDVNGMTANLPINEDCLYLSVFTPIEPGTSIELLPVYIWIHGGGFQGGTGAQYGAQYAIDHGIVIVTINYRLGAFGFLATEDHIIPGNLGLKDQRLTFEWVHDNIEAFNGDNGRVTISGQGASVGIHLAGAWNSERPSYQAAIQQSGTPISPQYQETPRKTAFAIGRILNPNMISDNSTELLYLLKTAHSEAIFEAGSFVSWLPSIEIEGDYSHHYLDAFMNGNCKRIPLIIGFVSEELLGMASNTENAPIFDADPSRMLSALLNISPENKTIVGTLLKNIYTNTSFEEDLAAYIRYSSDNNFTTPIIKQAELVSKFIDVYLYQFSYKGPLGHNMDIPDIPGIGKVGNAEDLAYFWDDGHNGNLSVYPEADQLMMQRYIKMWTNFIKYGNPTPQIDSLLQDVIWPKVDSNNVDEIPYLNMDVSLEVQTNPRYYQKVKKINDEYILPPYIIY